MLWCVFPYSGLLVMMSLFIATKTYVGDPIDCFTPQEFHDNWVAYTDNYCWVRYSILGFI